MNNLSLYSVTKDYEEAFFALADMDLPEDAISDTLEALEGELALKGANVAAFVLNLEAEAEKIKEAEKRIALRRKAFESKAQRIKDYLRENMERAGIKKIEALDKSFAVTLLAPRASVAIDDESALPSDCVKTAVSPDKAVIAQKLKDGIEVPGAHLEFKAGLRIS
jgi:hypothetical protein